MIESGTDPDSDDVNHPEHDSAGHERGRLRRAAPALLLLLATGLCVTGAWPWLVSWREGREPIATFQLRDASGDAHLVALFMPAETLQIDFSRATGPGTRPGDPGLVVQGSPLRAWWWTGAGWTWRDVGEGLLVLEDEVPEFHVVETTCGGALVVPGFYVDAYGLRQGELVKLEGEPLIAAREAAGSKDEPEARRGDTVIFGDSDSDSDSDSVEDGSEKAEESKERTR